MIFRWLLVALCLSCTAKETIRNPHQKLAPTQAATPLELKVCEETFTNTLAALCSPSSLTPESATNLLFSPELIHNPVLFYNDGLDSILWQVNQIVLDSNNASVIAQHLSNILSECHLSRADSCKIFHRFARINNTYDIFLHQLRANNSSHKIEDLILLADACLISRSALPLIQEIATRVGTLQEDARLMELVRNYLAIYGEQIPSLQKKQLFRYIRRLDGSYLNLLTRRELVEQINELHQQLPLSIFQKAEAIRPALKQALGLKALAQGPEFQLLDLVANQQLDLGDAQEILLKLIAESFLVETVKTFMRWTFAYQLQNTNNIAKHIIQTMNVGSNDLFDRFQTEADEIRKVWGSFKYQQQTFVTSLIRSNLATSTKTALRDLTTGLDQTIKMYSEYPHMFYIATYLAQQDFSRTVFIDGNRVRLSSNTIFNELVNPLRTKYSWFKYTEDFVPLNDLLIRNTLSYMMKSSFFPSMGISTEMFLGYFMKNLNTHFAERHHRKIVTMNNFIATENTYPRLKELCEQTSPELKVDFERLRMGFIRSNFSEKTFIDPIEVMMDNYTGGASGYLPFDRQTTPDFYEYAKTDLNYYKRILQLIDGNLKSLGQKSPALTKSLQDIEAKRAYAHTSFINWNSISACQLKLMKEERKIVSFIFEKENEYLREVHSDIRRLRAARSDAEAKQIFEKYKGIASFKLEELVPLQVKGLDIISVDGYFVTQFNFYARTAHYLKSYQGAVRPKVMLPPEIKKSPFYSYRDLRGNSQTVKPQFVPFQEGIADFIKYFCDIYYPRVAFTQWISISGIITAMSPYLKAQMATLAGGHITIPQYLDVYKDIVDFFKIQPLERELLGYLNDRSMVEASTFSGLFLQMNMQAGVYVRKFGLFDVTLTHLMEDVLGYDFYATDYLSAQDITLDSATITSMTNKMPQRRGPMAEAQLMHDTLREPVLARVLFGVDPSIIRSEYLTLKKSIADKRDFLDSFIAAVGQEDLSDVRVDIFVDDSITGPLFSPYILNRYQIKQNEFHQKTSGCFRHDSNCF
jgi:hypothetical protein